ncbi:MAG TPA: rhodanese-like domain-containing protein, partial [Polyangia bacterium]
ERFERGHIASARQLDRGEFSQHEPIPGLSVSRERLQSLLQARGVQKDSVVVLYGDGGPEPYRLWWTLREIAGYHARVLDGGLARWKQSGRPLVEGTPQPPRAGDVELAAPSTAAKLHWSEIEPMLREPGALLIDARSPAEFSGSARHDEAAAAGHIPGARPMPWTELVRSADDPRLKPVGELAALFGRLGVDEHHRVVVHCQSGTRSAVTYFALLQLGIPEAQLTNYNGSWAEYSRLGLPIELAQRAP